MFLADVGFAPIGGCPGLAPALGPVGAGLFVEAVLQRGGGQLVAGAELVLGRRSQGQGAGSPARGQDEEAHASATDHHRANCRLIDELTFD
jgi:hypothetical protein